MYKSNNHLRFRSGSRHYALVIWLTVMSLFYVAGCSKVPTGSSVAEAIAIQKTDFNGVWEIHDFDEVVRPEYDETNYTAEGQRRIAGFRKYFPEGKVKGPVESCLYQGMPWTMLTRARTYATEIYQYPDRIVLFHEGFDSVRNIRIGETEFPDNYSPSNQGYSIAHWEGDELVIETRGMIESNEYTNLLRSDEAKVIERWRLIKDPKNGERIIIDISLDDRVIYKEPAVGKQIYYRAPEGTIVGGYNCPNSLWDDFVEEHLIEIGVMKE